MGQDITEIDDAAQVGDALRQRGSGLGQLVEGFADDLELPLYRGA
jgi:hypothetical protein